MMKEGDEVFCNTDAFIRGNVPEICPGYGHSAIVDVYIPGSGILPPMIHLIGYEGFYNADCFLLMRTKKVFDAKLKPLLTAKKFMRPR